MRPITCLLFCATLLLPSFALAQAKPIRVRVGEHPGYSRIVFDWPAKGPYRVEQSGGRATISFDQPGTLDLSRYQRRPPPFVKGISPRAEGGGLKVDIEIPPGAKLRHFYNGTHVVLDVMQPAGGARQTAKAAPAAAAGASITPKGAAWSPKRAAEAAAGSKELVSRKTTTRTTQQAAKPAPSARQSDQSDYMANLAANDSGGKTRSADEVGASYNPFFDPHFTIGGNVSTLGFGAELGIRFNDYIGLRGGANYFGFDVTKEYTDIEYTADFQFLSAGGVLDIYPFGRIFRLTGGLRYNGNDIELSTGTPTTNVTVGGQTFSAAQVGKIEAKIDFNTIAPYAGLGFEGILANGHLSLAFDMGVLFQGSPDVDIESNGGGAPTLAAALQEEADDLEDDLSFLGFYPVVALTASYRF